MSTINIASKANQAITLPAVLVAQYAEESDPNNSITLNFEEIETLKSGDHAAVELVVGGGDSTYGFEPVISGLIQTYPLLQEKGGEAVCWL